MVNKDGKELDQAVSNKDWDPTVLHCMGCNSFCAVRFEWVNF